MPIAPIPRGKKIPYDDKLVPASMPMPLLQSVVVNSAEQYGVPHISDIQRAFCKTVFADYDMSALTEDDREGIKKKILDGKPFQHTPANVEAEQEEEAEMAKLIAVNIAEELAKLEKKSKAVKSDASGDSGKSKGKDVDAIRSSLRGFPIIGWKRAIQKDMSNSKNNTKLKTNGKVAKAVTSDASPAAAASSVSLANAATTSRMSIADAMRVLGLVGYTARQKFTIERHDEIAALARTYEGANAGANVNRAAKELWDAADHDEWEAAKEAEIKEIAGGPAECMAMLLMALSNSLSVIQDSGRFPAFFATLQLGYIDDGKMVFEIGEAMPAASSILPGFKEKNEKAYKEYLGRMHSWAEEGLQELVRTQSNGSAATEQPVFKLSTNDIDVMSAAEITDTVVDFLSASYDHVHKTYTIPWDEIIAEPSRFFDPDRLRLPFPLNDPTKLKGYERVQLATVLSEVAGPGTPNLFLAPSSGEDGAAAAQERERAGADRERVHQEREAEEVATAAAKARETAAAEQKARDDAEGERIRKEQEDEAAAARDRERAVAEQKARDEAEQKQREEAERKQQEEQEERARIDAEKANEGEKENGGKRKRGKKDKPAPPAPDTAPDTAPRRGGRERKVTRPFGAGDKAEGNATPPAKRRRT
ncbi:hypothetical protein C8F01DRAFT_1261139 [Mycena amicta]|nr:hypothetical protein C8F01DRAFT_1261139 [Mycena amicta]